MVDHAGHRTTEPHDCFLMNCKDLGVEVDLLRAQVVELATEKDRLQAIVDEEWGDPAAPSTDEGPPIRGEVGQLTGPPIVGTDDTINSGPPRGSLTP